MRASDGTLAVADKKNWRVSLFTLRGEPLRTVGSRGSGVGEFGDLSKEEGQEGKWINPPSAVALASGHLFVLTEKARFVHVFNPETGEPIATLVPPYNTTSAGSRRKNPGCLYGACVFDGTLYLSSGQGRIIALKREQGDGGASSGREPVDCE